MYLFRLFNSELPVSTCALQLSCMCRCLDVCLENEIERMHAIRLIRHINTVAPKEMPRSFVYSIIAIGNDGSNEHDRFVRVCLATLCEIGKYYNMCWGC